MKMDKKTYELIDAYLADTLQGQKLDAFKAELKSNSTLQEQVAIQKGMIDAIQQNRKLELKKYISDHTSKTNTAPLKSAKLKTAIAIAASVIFIVSIFFYFRPDPSLTQTALHFPDLDTVPQAHSTPHTAIEIDDKETSRSNQRSPKDTQRIAAQFDLKEKSIDPIIVEDEEIETDLMEINDVEDIDLESPESEEISTQEIQIASDQLIAFRQINVTSFLELNQENNLSENEKRLKFKKRNADNQALGKTASKEDTEVKTKAPITIEHWESVVKFTGYHFDGKKLKLFGIPKETPLQIIELEDRIYLKKEGYFYALTLHSNNRFIAETNTILLDLLHEY